MKPSIERKPPPQKPIAYRLLHAATLSCVLLSGSAIARQTSLTEQESVRIGMARPDLEEILSASQAAARSEYDATGRWPNPVLEIQRESIPAGAARTTERSAMLSQQFDVSGKRALRKGAAAERVAAATADAQQRRVELGADIKRRFYEALYRKELITAAQAWDQRMQTIGATVQKLHQGGEVAGYDRRRIALERASAQARLRT
jgi:outer membrane protein, heavy metal efflux system